MTPAEERTLLTAAQAGDIAARDVLVMANFGIVGKVANRYRSWRYPFEDLFDEGVIGLILAVGAFDLQQPMRFSTYAEYWIRSKIHNAADLNHHNSRPSYQVAADFPDLASPEDPAAEFADEDERAAVRSAVARLDLDDAALIHDRYWDGATLAAIGQTRHQSREWIRQQEANALARLRRMLPH